MTSNITSHSPKPPLMIFGEALASREPKDRNPPPPDPYNIDVEILLLYSVALISNVGLLTSEALYSESNEKYSTFNEEPCTINDGVETILIGDFCVFGKQWYTTGDFSERYVSMCNQPVIRNLPKTR